MITFNQLGMTYGQKLLFCDVTLTLNTGQAYALVGANGCGKSTFFKLITGEEEASFGEILIPKEASIGWLKQDQFRYEDTPIRDIVMQGKTPLWNALQEKDELLAQTTWGDKEGFRLAELDEVIYHEDGYNASSEIESILLGLGIAAEYHDRPLSALSGGYKLRVLLAQTLFQRPSILLLDEPTNHLDIVSIRWLEKFLKTEYKGLVIFISHDIDFINNLADNIFDIDYGEIRKYSGAYSRFLEEKNLIQEQKRIEKKSAEEKIAHLQKFVDRFGAKASKASLARSRMKMIEKIEIPDIVNSSRIAPHFHFAPTRPSGKQVCKVQTLSKSYPDRPLFKQLNFEIKRGDRIAIMGANGRGKSTLLKALLNLVTPDSGTITWGNEVHLSYFSQDHHDLLNRSMSVWQWLNDSSAKHTEQQLRKTLGQMLFPKENVDKDILALSGGEAARLLLAKVMLESPNVLILDEPTNHMDIETIDALADALVRYTGTLIFVSHNRHFIEKIATRILYFSDASGIRDFKNGYAEFVADGILDELSSSKK
jgi:ATPase subunit of ABC transporter with duplicated ATPase domains